VFLVAVNTWQIAEQKVIDKKFLNIFVVGFFISFIWTFNVKKIAFGNIWEQLSYGMGAGFGTIAGVFFAIKYHGRGKK